MNYSDKKHINDYTQQNQGLPVQQVQMDGSVPTEKEVRDAAREMGIDPKTEGRG